MNNFFGVPTAATADFLTDAMKKLPIDARVILFVEVEPGLSHAVNIRKAGGRIEVKDTFDGSLLNVTDLPAGNMCPFRTN